MLSEAGAAVVLKRLPPGEVPQPGDVELCDTAIASEAYDMVRPSPRMEALRHVAKRLLANRRIDMIHPHAPGTREHDPTELGIYRDLLAGNDTVPDLYAAKGALGHSLGAAGLCSLVLAWLSLTLGQRPPMPWLSQPIDAAGPQWQPTAGGQACSRTGVHAVFAAGFAGHTAGAVLQRH